MSVPFYDHVRLYERDKAAIDAAIARVIAGGRFDWGPEVPAFEAAFAAWNGAAHAVGVNSGTAALKISLLALGIGPGDEVVTVANTDIGTVSAIVHTGARPVFADIEPLSRTLDPAAAAAVISPRTRAILGVDLFGHPADMPALRALCTRHGLALVEDACLSLGAEIGGRKVGTLADVTCFSFAPSKHLGSFGSGGACLTEDGALAERMRKISAYGQPREKHYAMHGTRGMGPLNHEEFGLNERLDELQAAILSAKLPGLDSSLAARRRNAAFYLNALRKLPIDLPCVRSGFTHSWRNFVIEADDRDALAERLAARGIATSLAYAPPLHRHAVLAGTPVANLSLPATERSCDRLLGLPVGPHLTSEERRHVVEAVIGSIG